MNTPRPDANATIQLDALDALADLQLDELDELNARRADDALGDAIAVKPSARPTPPPLPPSVGSPSLASQVMAPPAASPRTRKPLVYGAVFVALLGVSIAGGLRLGLALRRAAPPVTPSITSAPIVAEAQGAQATPAAAPSPSAPAVITIPTVELSGPSTSP